MKTHSLIVNEHNGLKYYEADVIRVVDGDTIEVRHNYRTSTIRIKGMDAPESNQPHGWEAHKFLHDLIGNKTVLIETNEVGKYGREIASVYDSDNNNVSEIMIASGYAWADFEHNKFDPEMKQLQDNAKKEQLGLWADKYPVQPKVWRDENRTMGDKEKKELREKKKVDKENNGYHTRITKRNYDYRDSMVGEFDAPVKKVDTSKPEIDPVLKKFLNDRVNPHRKRMVGEFDAPVQRNKPK